MTTPWPPEADLRDRLLAVLGGPGQPRPPHVIEWQDTAFRFSELKYAARSDFTTGEGARRHGGRFTPCGGPCTVYLSLEPETAAGELMSWYAYYQLPATAFRPRVLAAVGVSVGFALEMTSPKLLGALGLTSEMLATEWRDTDHTGGIAPTQTLGRLLFETGLEGFLVSSARRLGGVNLILFPENFRPGSHALMIGGEDH